MVLDRLRQFEDDPKADDSTKLLHHLVREDPTIMAEDSAKRGDYKLIGLAMGLHADRKKVKPIPFGVNCAEPIPTQDMIWGCIPPPPVIFKLIERYNTTLIQQPGFPPKAKCQVDPRTSTWIEKYEREMDSSFKKDLEKSDEEQAKSKRQ